MRSSEQKKKIITISVLAAILVALICVYFFVIVPLTEPDAESGVEPPEIIEGEGLYMDTMITVYPQLDKSKIEYLEIKNKNGTFAFHMDYNDATGRREMRIKGHEAINYDESLYAMLIAYVYLPVSYQSNTEANAPMRDVSVEKMKEYGVTEDTCQASYTVGYVENGVTKYHTIYIGNPTFTQETTYFVALKGRNAVYRFHQEGVETCMLVGVENYLSPFIFGKYESALVAMTKVERFKIGFSNPEKLGQSDYIESLVELVKAGQNIDGTTNMYDLYYKSRGSGKITRTGANATRLNTAFGALFTYFAGDKVVCLNPDSETLDKYGLSEKDACYFITAQLSSKQDDMYSMYISDLIDGYYYTLSNVYGDNNAMLVRVPKGTLSFLGRNDEAIFEWAGTDISSLFYEYLKKTEDQPGMYQIDIRIQKKDDATGKITYNVDERFTISEDDNGSTVATQVSNGTKYPTIDTVNQFVNFYTLLIRLPAPSEFNNMTKDEIDALMADDSAIVFELVARRHDDKVFKYTYYQIGKSVDVMAVTQEGHMDGGAIIWDEEPQISFNVTMSHIEILRENFQKLINGEEVNID